MSLTPYLYTIVEKQRLSDMLKAFYSCVDLPIQAIDDTGRILDSCGKVSSFCSLLKNTFRLRKTAASFMRKPEKGPWTWEKRIFFPAMPT